MQKLDISKDAAFADLDLEKFNSLRYAVYVIDHDWNYLFVNDYVTKNLGLAGENLAGQNMWNRFEQLASDPSFQRMKQDIEKGLPVNFITTSPLNAQRLNIVGYVLQDCYLFHASQLPKKDELLSELRGALNNG